MAAKSKRGGASKTIHARRFPGESGEYRAARDRLLREEMELRRSIEKVAASRRRLPPGGLVPQDYLFEEGSADLESQTVRQVRMSELFRSGWTSLVVYSFMYGPRMEVPCPMCTSMLDGLNGSAPHLAQRTNLVVVAKSPIHRIRAFARGRGWRNLRLLSSADNSYNRDYHGEDEKGAQWPMLNVFVKRDGVVRHFWASELLFAPADPGQNPRHVDLAWPLWNVLDFTPEGRGKDWYPKLSYG
ncbi:MAG TPA: DUF899 family protein [Burkholderiales bacterium]|nr:DUF899 family protein [Burkholderiales bacterium]